MKKTMVDFNRWLDKRLGDSKLKEAYEQADEDPFINVALQLIRLREEKHLTQAHEHLRYRKRAWRPCGIALFL